MSLVVYHLCGESTRRLGNNIGRVSCYCLGSPTMRSVATVSIPSEIKQHAFRARFVRMIKTRKTKHYTNQPNEGDGERVYARST